MALILCKECGKQYSDKAVACVGCGCPTEYNLVGIMDENSVAIETSVEEAISEEEKIKQEIIKKNKELEERNRKREAQLGKVAPHNTKPMTAKEKAIDEEYKILKGRNTSGNRTASWTLVALGCLALLVKSYLGAAFFIGLGLYLLIGLDGYNRRMKELEKMKTGQRQVYMCPFCKSENIGSEVINRGSYTSGQSARVSYNINPLHPLTHTNIKSSGQYTSNSYGTLYMCYNCGKTFSKPQSVWN